MSHAFHGRSGLEPSPVVFLCCNRSTHSDVMSTTNTTRVSTLDSNAGGQRHNAELRRMDRLCNLPYRSASAVQPPMVGIPIKRRNKQLLAERDDFMDRLLKERDDRLELETWAATCVQAHVRGLSVRGPGETYIPRKRRLTSRDGEEITDEKERERAYIRWQVCGKMIYALVCVRKKKEIRRVLFMFCVLQKRNCLGVVFVFSATCSLTSLSLSCRHSWSK